MSRLRHFADWYVYRSPPGRLVAWLAATRPFQAFGRAVNNMIDGLR